jgi:predicted phage terminase large subunit-like protein
VAPGPRVVWEPNPGPQTQFLASTATELLFGGAGGGGKSAGITALPTRWVHIPQFRALTLRRETTQLQDLIDKSWALYPRTFPGVRYNANEHAWTFPSGARLRFNHCKEESDKYDYQGQEFQLITFDELTHFTLTQYLEIASRLRSATPGLPRYLRSTSNPGGAGHAWVFTRWGAWLNPDFEAEGLVPRFAPDGRKLPPAAPGQVLWVLSTNEGEVYVPKGTPGAMSRQFIPALLKDNPKLLANDPNYEAKLNQLDPVRRAQLRDGNWLAATGKKLYFDRSWVGDPIDAAVLPPTLRWVRAWDLAATAPSKDYPDPDWTRGVKMALWGERVVVADVASTRNHPGEVDAFLLATAQADGPTCLQVVPQDPGSAGKTLAAHYQTLLRGYPVSVARPSQDKLTRFRPFSGFAAPPKRGVVVVRGAWNGPYFDELEAFEGKDKDRDDQVDATSDGFAHLAPPAAAAPDPGLSALPGGFDLDSLPAC